MQPEPRSNLTLGTVSRRSAIAALCAMPMLGRANTKPSAKTWRLVQSASITGPLAELGLAMNAGAKAAFAEINAQGGIHGIPIELVTLDDGYEVKRALANVEGFLKDPNAFALFNCMGTPAVSAMLPMVIESGLPFFAPFTGAQLARPKGQRSVFNVRASYADEAEQVVQHLATVGIKRIAIAYQNNAFGSDVLLGAQAAIERFKLPPTPTVSVETNSSNIAEAVSQLAEGNPEAVIVGIAGEAGINLIKATRNARRGLAIYALSVLGSSGSIRSLGEDGFGVTVSQVMPFPTSPAPIARDFRAAWKASATPIEASHLALEGYINARAFAVALKRAGASATPKSFIDSAWTIKRHDLGGFDLTFSDPSRGASKYVDLTMVGRNGKLMR